MMCLRGTVFYTYVYVYIESKVYFQRFTSQLAVTRCASAYRIHNCKECDGMRRERKREREIQISFVEIAVNNKWII